MGRLIEWIYATLARLGNAACRRSRVVARGWQAWVRYRDLSSDQLAAASAYYGFFAVLGMGVIAFVVIAQVFQNNVRLTTGITNYLAHNLPQLQTRDLITTSGRIGLVALTALLLAGVSWVRALRSTLRGLWQLDREPGNPVLSWLVDLGVLASLGVLLLISVALFSGLQELLIWLVGGSKSPVPHQVFRVVQLVLPSLIDLILGAALLCGIPRLHMSMRRLLPATALFALGFGLLKSLGMLYITRTEHNPAYQIAAGAVGLLVFMYLFHQILLFCAAVAATSHHGQVLDLAYGRPYRPVGTSRPAQIAEPDPSPESSCDHLPDGGLGHD